MADLPVELGHAVVDPSVVHPFEHVGIEFVVVLQSAGRAAVGVRPFVAVDAEGRDAKLHPRFNAVDLLAEGLDEDIDIVAAPVGNGGKLASVAVVGGLVGDGDARHGIGIEVVVDMEAIDVIAADDIADDAEDVVAVLALAGVEDLESVIVEDALGMGHGDVVDGQLARVLRLRTIGIDPGVELHAAAVTLVDHPLQRVPIGRGRRALATGQEAAPRLVAARVEGVALGAHLEDNGVDAVFLQLVELIGQRALHLLGAEAKKLAVDALDPSAAKLALRTALLGHQLADGQQKEHRQPYHSQYLGSFHTMIFMQ